MNIVFKGTKQPISLCGLTTLDINPPSLFQNFQSDYKPIAIKSRKYSKPQWDLIQSEVRLLIGGAIELSSSPWQAQVVVTTNKQHKKRMAVDYPQTINRFIQPTLSHVSQIKSMNLLVVIAFSVQLI